MARMSIRWWLVLLLCVGLGSLRGYSFTSQGFNKLQQLREMERIPLSRNIAVLPGEVKISGVAEGETIQSHYTNTPCLYFYYTREEEETDSDGNRSWKTVGRIRRAANLTMRDTSGAIQVLSKRDLSEIDWQIQERYLRTIGSTRHTEYRIDPGQRLVAFGYAEAVGNGLSLGFRKSVQYRPVIANSSSATVLGKIGSSVLFRLWLGLTLCCVAVYGFICILGIHRVLVFVSIIATTATLILVQLSLLMMKGDLNNGVARFQKQSETVVSLLPRENIDATQSLEMRLALALAHIQLEQQFKRVPERWLSPMWSISVPVLNVSLSQEEQSVLQARKQNLDVVKLPRVFAFWLMGVSAIIAAAAIYFGIKLVFIKRAIESIRTRKALGVSCGLNEVIGH